MELAGEGGVAVRQYGWRKEEVMMRRRRKGMVCV
jgi:hypothetical protein